MTDQWICHACGSTVSGRACQTCHKREILAEQARRKHEAMRVRVNPDVYTIAEQDAKRLGHQLGIWHFMVGGSSNGMERAVCHSCGDHVNIEPIASFGRERVRGPAIAMRCEPKQLSLPSGGAEMITWTFHPISGRKNSP